MLSLNCQINPTNTAGQPARCCRTDHSSNCSDITPWWCEAELPMNMHSTPTKCTTVFIIFNRCPQRNSTIQFVDYIKWKLNRWSQNTDSVYIYRKNTTEQVQEILWRELMDHLEIFFLFFFWWRFRTRTLSRWARKKKCTSQPRVNIVKKKMLTVRGGGLRNRRGKKKNKTNRRSCFLSSSFCCCCCLTNGSETVCCHCVLVTTAPLWCIWVGNSWASEILSASRLEPCWSQQHCFF